MAEVKHNFYQHSLLSIDHYGVLQICPTGTKNTSMRFKDITGNRPPNV